MPDSLLLNRARRGDQEAVAELYRTHVGAAMRYARAIAPSNADAEDLVSESFARVIAQLALDRGPDSSFRAYLFTTMRHRLYSTNRREYVVGDDSVLDRPFDDRAAHDRADHELLNRAFDSLRPQEQEVLLLLDINELRPSEVCERLGLRSSALSMRVARARSALAEAYLVAHVQPSADRDCQLTRQQLGRHVRGKLSTLRTRQVNSHLEDCDSCSAALIEITNVNSAMRALPIFAIPTASRAQRALLRTLRGGHAGAAPTAVKVAVIASAITAGSGAAVVLVSNAQSTAPSAAGRALFVVPSIPTGDTSAITTAPAAPGLTPPPTRTSPTFGDASRPNVPLLPSAASSTSTPAYTRYRSTPSAAGSTPSWVKPTPPTATKPAPPTSSAAAQTPSGSASNDPSSSDAVSSPTPSEPTSPATSAPATPTATPPATPTPTATPSPSGSTSSSTCAPWDFRCWWQSIGG